MKAYIALLIAFAVLFAACTAKTESAEPRVPTAPPQDLPTEPTAPAQQGSDAAAATGEVGAVESGTDKTFGDVDRASALKIDDVLCDKETKTITFRFKNEDTKSWQMNQQVPFPSPKDLEPVRIFINSYEANNRNGYLREGVRYFGPEETFSDNCGGVEVLAPGADVTCTLTPVPLKSANDLTVGKNNIFVDSPTSHHIIEFLCE